MALVTCVNALLMTLALEMFPVHARVHVNGFRTPVGSRGTVLGRVRAHSTARSMLSMAWTRTFSSVSWVRMASCWAVTESSALR